MAQLRFYDTTPTMPTLSAGDNTAVTVGLYFTVSTPVNLVAILWWQCTNNRSTADRTIGLYTTTNGLSGTLVGSTKTQAVSGVGWQTVTLDAPVALAPGTLYMAAVHHPEGLYPAIGNYYTPGGPGYGGGNGTTVDAVTVLSTNQVPNTGQNPYVYGFSFDFPQGVYQGSMYGVDILFESAAGGSPGGDVHVYDGAQWQSGYLHVYDGTQWISSAPQP